MANEMQRTVVGMLGTDEDGDSVAKFTLAVAVQSAICGNEESASAALLLCAEVFRQEREFPKELMPFLVSAMDAAASSGEVCRALAGTTGKRGAKKKRQRDAVLFAGDASRRRTMPKKEERVAALAKLHHVDEETVKTVLKDRASRTRSVLARADDLIAGGNSSKFSPPKTAKK